MHLLHLFIYFSFFFLIFLSVFYSPYCTRSSDNFIKSHKICCSRCASGSDVVVVFCFFLYLFFSESVQ